MFEQLFGPKTPEDKERLVIKAAMKEFETLGVNLPGLHHAFDAAQQINEKKKLGLTNNHLLNLIKNTAISSSSSIEDSMYGGTEQTMANIESGIAKLRSELSDEERRS